MPEDRGGEERIGDHDAHRLIARAAELDSAREQLVSLAQIRAAALDAGISAAAFDEALHEFRAVLGGNAVASITDRHSRSSGLPGRVRRWFRTRVNAGSSTLGHGVRLNALALLATWGGMTLVVRALALFRLGDGAVTVAIVTSLVAGGVLAHRLGARVARFLLVALAVAFGSEMLLDLIAGHPVVHGNGAHFALLAAGFIGVGVGVALGTNERAGSSGSEASTQPLTRDEPEAHGRSAAAPPDTLLRLRPAAGTLG